MEVEPGRSASVTLTVRNTGSVVDRFGFEAVGIDPRWVTFNPDTLSLFPEATGTVEVTVAPPREPSVAAGPTPFGVKVDSSEDPTASVVEEATVVVGAFSDVSMELLPRVSRGRMVGRAQVAVDNRSNVAYLAELSATDPSDALLFGLSPATVDVAPGAAEFAKVRIRPRRRFWRGPSIHKQFRVVATRPADEALPAGVDADPHPKTVDLDGSFMQDPMLPSWAMKALAALLALIALLVILWFALLKPQIRNTAQTEVNKQLTANGITTTTVGGGSGGGASNGGGSGSGGSGSGGGSGGGTITTNPGNGGSSGSGSGSSSVVVNGTRSATGNGTVTLFVVPKGHILNVTDLLVQNAAGDNGTMSLARSGTPLMVWALPNFRDLDYHWIVPTQFGPGTAMQLIVNGCSSPCSPGIYYAGNLVKS
jgi:hypothetical protein